MADNADVKPGDKVLFGHRAARVVAVNGDQIEVEYRDTNTGSTVRRWTRAALAELLHTVGVETATPEPVIDEPPLDDDDTVEIPLALQEQMQRIEYEVQTVEHDIMTLDQRRASDMSLAAMLRAGWRPVGVNLYWGSDRMVRIVTLTKERVVPYVPDQDAAQPARRINVVGPVFVADPLAATPIARAIREFGREAVVAALNNDALKRGLDAAQYRLAQNTRIYTRKPGLPGRRDA